MIRALRFASGLCLFTLLATALQPSNARAAPNGADAARHAEAQERFDRGLDLLQKKNHEAAALAEFQRAYELVPATRTLFMIGVVDGMMDRPVEAVHALDQVLRDPGPLPADQIAVARQRHDEQLRRVAYVRVSANVPAVLQVDGIDTGRLPIAAPIAVAAGTRILAAIAAGHLPARKEITVAGGTTTDVAFDLVPTENEASHIRVSANLPDADIFIDGERVGRTPLPSSVTVAPGKHLVEARRAGYQLVSREIALQNGAQADLSLDLAESAASESAHGKLVLAISEPEAEVAIDGIARGVYRRPLALPPGRHAIRVARAGFVDNERTVDVAASGDTTEEIALQPTPDTRAAYMAHARGVRRWGWIAVASGAVLLAGGATLTAYEWQRVTDARAARDALFTTGPCSGMTATAACMTAAGPANAHATSVETWRAVGLAGAGVGVAAAATGAILLLTGDDPDRYDEPRFHARADKSSRAPFDVTVAFGARLSSLVLLGRF